MASHREMRALERLIARDKGQAFVDEMNRQLVEEFRYRRDARARDAEMEMRQRDEREEV